MKSVKIICLLLALCLALSAFAGCKPKDNITSSSEPATSDVSSEDQPSEETPSDEEPSSSEEETAEEEDEWFEDLPFEEEEGVYYEELTVKNSKPSSTYFRGFNYIHQMASYQKDSLGRLYTDAQRKYELELMQNMGVRMVRSFYGSSFTYNAETGEQEYGSQRMQDFFTACKAMDSIGADVGVTAIWSMKSLIENKTNKTSENFHLGCPGIVVKDDWNATLKNYREFMKNTVLALKANGVNNVKYFFAYTECNNSFNDGLNSKGETAENSRDDREYEKLYPLYDDLITALDGGLKDAGLRNQYKIVGPCDNWRADDGSEPESLLVKYTVENLSDKVDIIGSHNGYDRSTEYVNDMFYDIPFEKLTYPMEQAKKIGKEFWVDEYNVAVSVYGYENVRVANKNPWKGVAAGAMASAIMNMGDVSNIFLWTLWDEQWPDNTNNDKAGEFDNGVQVCGYLNCLFETQTPLYPWYSVSLITRYVGEGNVYPCEGPGFATYISAIKRNDGETTLIATNYDIAEANVKINFEKSMGGKNFYRYIYDTTTIEPASSYEIIAADAVAKNVTTGFYDVLPAGSVAIYTTEKPDFVK